MFRRILLATDSSPASLAVVGCARALHLLGAQDCVLVQCFLIREHVAFPDQIKTYIQATLTRQKTILESQGLRTVVVAEPGFPAREIPRIATERDCSVIVIGSHGHNLAHEMFLGSTAAELLHRATRPILIIPLKIAEQSGQTVVARKRRDFRHHILYATDFSGHAKRAFDYVSELVKAGTRRVTLLHVQDKAKLDTHLKNRLDEFNKTDRGRLEEMKDRLEAVGTARITMDIPYGAPTEEILKRAKAANTSLVVLGSHGRGFVSELFLGSVSHNVVRHSQVPVLVIPFEHMNVDSGEQEPGDKT
jgi:nucleotide-binding universal stress UspA family protein